MSTIAVLKTEETAGRTQELLMAAKKKLGMVPNLFGVMAHSPAVLETYLMTTQLLGEGKLSAAVRQQIAVAIAAANGCEYCLSAHTAIGKMLGITSDDLAAAQNGNASDAKTRAVLDLALELNRTHGKGSPQALAKAQGAGLSDEEMLETVANVTVNILTNSINNLVGTPIDFPKTSLNKAAA